MKLIVLRTRFEDEVEWSGGSAPHTTKPAHAQNFAQTRFTSLRAKSEPNFL